MKKALAVCYLAITSVVSACGEAVSLPRILLVGDSISIGYADAVTYQLRDKADVQRISENGGSTTNTLANINKWLGGEKWDVIYFNCGLHDIRIMPDGTRQVSQVTYEANLRRLVRELKVTKAVLIWASTTPVPTGGEKLVGQRIAADVSLYNAIASRVMVQEHVAIDDLYEFAQPQLSDIQRPANVHFTAAGSRILGERVATTIARYLPDQRPGLP